MIKSLYKRIEELCDRMDMELIQPVDIKDLDPNWELIPVRIICDTMQADFMINWYTHEIDTDSVEYITLQGDGEIGHVDMNDATSLLCFVEDLSENI